MLYIHIGLCVSHSVVSDFVTPLPVARQTPQSMEFLRQEYWSGLWFPTPGDLPGPGIKPGSQCTAGKFFTIWTAREAQ